MDEVTTDLHAVGLTVGLGALAFLGIAGAVLVARAALPTVERLASVDLRALSAAFGEVLSQVSDIQGRRSIAPRSN